jgi:hypothetical protein
MEQLNHIQKYYFGEVTAHPIFCKFITTICAKSIDRFNDIAYKMVRVPS